MVLEPGGFLKDLIPPGSDASEPRRPVRTTLQPSSYEENQPMTLSHPPVTQTMWNQSAAAHGGTSLTRRASKRAESLSPVHFLLLSSFLEELISLQLKFSSQYSANHTFLRLFSRVRDVKYASKPETNEQQVKKVHQASAFTIHLAPNGTAALERDGPTRPSAEQRAPLLQETAKVHVSRRQSRRRTPEAEERLLV